MSKSASRARSAGFLATIAVVATGSLSSCASSTAVDGLDAVNELARRIGALQESIDSAKLRVDAAIAALEALGRFQFNGDPEGAYESFSSTVEASAAEVDVLRESVASMREVADPMFMDWEDHLATITGEQMRKHGESRRAEMLARFESIVASADQSIAACESFNKRLADHVAYLRYDFNSASVAVVQGEVAELTRVSDLLDIHFRDCKQAARAYVECAALPQSAGAPPVTPPRTP